MLLVFDCDGVVLDSMMLHSAVESEAYAKLGIAISPQELSRRFAGVSQLEVSRILAEETGQSVPVDFNVEKLKEDVFAQRMKAVPYIHEALNRLGFLHRCIASGSGMATLRQCLSLVGLYDHFAPHIYSSEFVAKGKPAPDLFLYAAKQTGFAPEDCLVIEDGVAGVQAAEAARMRVIGFTGGCHCDEQHGDRLIAAGAEEVFSDMRMLPNLVNKYNEPKVRSRR